MLAKLTPLPLVSTAFKISLPPLTSQVTGLFVFGALPLKANPLIWRTPAPSLLNAKLPVDGLSSRVGTVTSTPLAADGLWAMSMLCVVGPVPVGRTETVPMVAPVPVPSNCSVCVPLVARPSRILPMLREPKTAVLREPESAPKRLTVA